MSLMLIGYNIFSVLKQAMEYNNIRLTILDQLNVLDSLEVMSQKEMSEYSEDIKIMKTIGPLSHLCDSEQKRIAMEAIAKKSITGINKNGSAEECTKDLGNQKNSLNPNEIHPKQFSEQHNHDKPVNQTFEFVNNLSQVNEESDMPEDVGHSLKKKRK